MKTTHWFSIKEDVELKAGQVMEVEIDHELGMLCFC